MILCEAALVVEEPLLVVDFAVPDEPEPFVLAVPVVLAPDVTEPAFDPVLDASSEVAELSWLVPDDSAVFEAAAWCVS